MVVSNYLFDSDSAIYQITCRFCHGSVGILGIAYYTSWPGAFTQIEGIVFRTPHAGGVCVVPLVPWVILSLTLLV